MSDTKQCARCKETKPEVEFYACKARYRRKNGGRFWICKICEKEYRRTQYQKHRNSELAAIKKRRVENPDLFKSYDRRKGLKRYGLSEAAYQALLSKQGGKCAACGISASNGRHLDVDHNHRCCPDQKKSCGKCIRALLCNRCNRAVGILGEDPNVAFSVASYLEKHTC